MVLSSLTPECLPRFFHSDRRTENGSWLDRWLGPPAPRRICYPLYFRVLALGHFFGNVLYVAYHAHSFHPSLKRTGNTHGFLSVNALALRIVLAWFALTQAIHFLPCVSSRVARLYMQTSCCKAFCLKLVFWDGSMYLFTILTMSLVSFAFVALTDFQDNTQNYSLFSDVIMYGVMSGMVGVFGAFFAVWHHRLIMCTLEPLIKNRMALPAIIDRLESCTYEQVVGNGKKLYPAECAICLGAWEPLDRIKLTPCKHTFHEECIASWLKTANTCALCRLDLVSAVVEHNSV